MQLAWTAPAEGDIYEISDYYREIDPDLSMQMLRRIYDAPLILLDRPFLGTTTRKPDVRKWSVKMTSFILLYAVRPRFIEVRRVVHVRSNWRELEP